MTNHRDQILLTTRDLVENQGFQATGLNQIVRESGAPKGSIYYYFPEGKDEIVAEAVLSAGQQMSQHIHNHLAGKDDAAEAIQAFISELANHIEESGFRAGGPITIVASESATTSERINRACQKVYTNLHEVFTKKLIMNGVGAERAESMAWMIISTIEGAVILSRTFHNVNPLLEASQQLTSLIRLSQ
jgi:TetR/AcrR family transcriptional regulator, lmrAB and yxaGH operons repressor